MNSFAMKNKWGVFLVILLVTIAYQLLMAISLSPLSDYEGCDSLIFKQMGLSMLQDKVLYLDLFDHKGPIIYFINAFCQWLLPGRWGLFLVFSLYMATVTYVWWLTASLFLKSRSAFWPVVIGLSSYIIVLAEGNLSEEWSLLPISYCLYVFAKHFVEDSRISFTSFFLVGVSMGVVTFLRINNMAAPCCAILVYTIYHLKQRTTVTLSDFVKSFLMMFLGWAVVISLCCLVIWVLYGHEGIEAMVFGTFIFNFEYMGTTIATALDRRRVYLYFGLTTLIILSLLYLKKRVSVLTILIGLCYIGSFVAIGSKGWGNYFIIFAPLTVVATASMYDVLNKWQKALLFLMFFVIVPYKFYLAFTSYQEERPFIEADKVIQNIPCDEQMRIWNSANFDGVTILHRNGLIQANRVMLAFQMLISERLKQSEIERFSQVNPVWIMASEPFQKEVPLPLDSVKVIHDYTLQTVVGNKSGHQLYFYRVNRK